jgi:hypothetical protein
MDPSGNITRRFIVSGQSVYFPKVNLNFHISFSRKYYNMDIVKIRQTLKKYYTHSEQDEIIHYLKNKYSHEETNP